MADVIDATIRQFDIEYNSVEQAFLIHGVCEASYERTDEINSHTIIILNDGSRIEDIIVEGNSRYVSNRGWSQLEIKDFFMGMVMENALIEELFDNQKGC